MEIDTAQQSLRAYYEEEARLQLRQPAAGRRVELRDEFVALLRAEGRRSVVDFGAGPGLDGEGFAAMGLDFTGLDLAHRNAVRAAERDILVVQGSIDAPPFQHAIFDAGWSMSTLMHIRQHDVSRVLSAMAASLAPGSPLLVGMWGGDQGEISGALLGGHPRLFSLRPFDVNLELLAAWGEIEDASTWDATDDAWQYQVFRLRIGP